MLKHSVRVVTTTRITQLSKYRSMLLPSGCLNNTDECIKALHAAADLWFGRLSLSTKVVAVGLILEAPELGYEIWAIIRRKKDEWKLHITFPESHAPDWVKVIAFLGWMMIVGGVVGEWVTEGKFNEANTNTAELNDISLARAITESGSAKDSAEGARDAAKIAKGESDKAVESASSALTIASGARLEADSFESDIEFAKKQAADAESHLADALKQAADATAELNRLKSPRLLTNVSELVLSLQALKGTEYTFSAVFADEESIDLLKGIDSALQLAGWKRVKAPGGPFAINVYGKDVDFSVPTTVLTGFQVSTDSSEELETLQSTPIDKLPLSVRNALTLQAALINIISPKDKSQKPVDVEKGTSATMRITVGKKP